MNAITKELKGLSVESREVPSPNPGESATTFLSFLCFDGKHNQKIWAFSDDFPNPPQESEVGRFEAVFRAKSGKFGPYLSVCGLLFSPCESD